MVPRMGENARPSVLGRLASVRGVARARTLPFFAVGGVHLAAHAVAGLGVGAAGALAGFTKPALMPALGLVLADGLDGVRQAAGRLPRWWPLAAGAVGFSWLGDLALMHPDGFLAGVGLFGVAQVCYATTFVRAGDASRTAGRPGLLVPYAVWWAGLLGFFAATQGVTPMTGAVAGYGLLLGAMAHLAHRVSPTAAVGAGLFVLSDSLIGLRGSGVQLPLDGVWVMSTYLLAQWLIVRELVALGARQGDAAPVAARTGATASGD